MSQLIKTVGFVLRIVPFQDHDLILTAFTADLGKVALFVKGARRHSSRFGPEIDLLSQSEFILLNSKNVKPLREATLQDYYPLLKRNYDHLNSAMHGARLLSRMVHEGQKDFRNHHLFSSFLQVLDRAECAVSLYELAFKLRLLDNFGVGPQLSGCLRCGNKTAATWFSLERGGLMCDQCHTQNNVPIKGGLVQSLNALRGMAWEKLERLQLSPQAIAFSNKILDQFMTYHVPAHR